jgi:hypothetical protein
MWMKSHPVKRTGLESRETLVALEIERQPPSDSAHHRHPHISLIRGVIRRETVSGYTQ